MADTGFVNGTVSTDSAAEWATPNNIFTSDNVYTTNTLAASATSSYVGVKTFGLSVTSSSIDGIQVQVEVKQSGTGNLIYTSPTDVQVSKDGTTWFQTTYTPGTITGTDAYYQAGGATDKWGTTWTDANVNGANFQIRFRFREDTGTSSVTASVDNAQVKVFYTPVAGSVGTSKMPLLGCGSG